MLYRPSGVTRAILAVLALVLASCGSGEGPAPEARPNIHLFAEPTTGVELPKTAFSGEYEVAFASGRLWVLEDTSRDRVHRTDVLTLNKEGILWSFQPSFRPTGGARRVVREQAHDRSAGKILPEGERVSALDLGAGELLIDQEGVSFCVGRTADGKTPAPPPTRIAYETRTEDIIALVLGSTPEAGSLPQPRSLTWKHETRRAVIVAPGTAITWRVEVPDGGRLTLGYGTEAFGMQIANGEVVLRGRPETTATFEVSVRTEGEPQAAIVWQGEAKPRPPGHFTDVDIDVAAYAGQLVELRLRASAPVDDDGNPPQTFPFWTEPVLHGDWPSPPPNVIVLLLDTLRADRLGCYGWERAQTPHLDALAARGVLFTRAWSAAPWTLPSHASLFTSLHLSEHGVWSPDQRLPDVHVTLAEVLRAHGYSTNAFTEGGYVQPRYGFAQGFDRFVVLRHGFRASKTFRSAMASIQNARAPFFCFVQTYEVHSPYDPPADERERLVDPYSGELPAVVHTTDFPWGRGQAHHLDAADLKYMSDLYDAEVASVDKAVGQFVESLEDAGLFENTLLIVTSDHGEEFGEHGHFAHGWSLYEEQLRVPLIMYSQAGFQGGLVLDHPVHGIDLAPTIAAVAGASAPDAWSGQALSLDPAGDHPLFVPYRTRNFGAPAVTLMDGSLKYIEFNNRSRPGDVHTGPMLFNIDEDPGETTNLWSPDRGPEWAGKVELLRSRYPLSWDPDRPEADEAVNAELRALGYLGDE